MIDPLSQIENNKNDIREIKVSIDIMIKSFLAFIGHSDKVEEFRKVYADTYSNETGVSCIDNQSIGVPTLTKYSREEKAIQWSLKINIIDSKTDSTSPKEDKNNAKDKI